MPRSVSFDVVDPASSDAVWAMEQYFDELDQRFPQGFDPGDALTVGLDAMRPPDGAFVLSRRDDVVVGCGGVQTIGPGIGEVKRMWVSPGVRGQGLGRLLLDRLEDEAARLGHHTVRLDTNGQLGEAIAMYGRAGYVEIDRYNDNPYAERFFEKPLVARSGRDDVADRP